MEIDNDTTEQDMDEDANTEMELHHEHSKSSGSTGNEWHKFHCISAGQGMITGAATLGEYISNVLENLSTKVLQAKSEKTSQAGPCQPSESIEPAATGSATFNRAYFAINDNKGLSDNDMADVGDILRREPNIGATYLAMSRPHVRTYFLRA